MRNVYLAALDGANGRRRRHSDGRVRLERKGDRQGVILLDVGALESSALEVVFEATVLEQALSVARGFVLRELHLGGV